MLLTSSFVRFDPQAADLFVVLAAVQVLLVDSLENIPVILIIRHVSKTMSFLRCGKSHN